jgi:thioredoxin-like negative regulator of GroEL
MQFGSVQQLEFSFGHIVTLHSEELQILSCNREKLNHQLAKTSRIITLLQYPILVQVSRPWVCDACLQLSTLIRVEEEEKKGEW